MTKLARRGTQVDPLVEIEPLLKEFGGHRKMLTSLKTRSEELRDRMMAILERHGQPDDKGSLWIEFTDPVAGFSAIKRERRAKVLLDEAKAEAILRAAGAWEDCIDVRLTIDADKMDAVLAALKVAGIYDDVVTVTEVINDDKIMQVFFAEKDAEEPRIDESDIDAMFREQVSYAFIVKDQE